MHCNGTLTSRHPRHAESQIVLLRTKTSPTKDFQWVLLLLYTPFYKYLSSLPNANVMCVLLLR